MSIVDSQKTCTGHELWLAQAPNFNFERGQAELVREGLARGYIKKIEGEDDLYLINQNYGIRKNS